MSLSDPHPGFARVMSVFRGPTGDPSDVFVTNWTFRLTSGDESVEGSEGELRDVLDSFWYGSRSVSYPGGSSTVPVAGLLSDAAIAAHEYRMYDLADPIPRPPTIVEPSLTADFGSAQPMPRESAVCISTRTAVRSKRGRGRVYIGPFTTAALGDDSAAGDGTVSARARATLAAAAADVLETTRNVEWMMYSPTDDVFRLITGGYVDSEWDHQQRRAPNGSVRVPFGSYLPGQ